MVCGRGNQTFGIQSIKKTLCCLSCVSYLHTAIIPLLPITTCSYDAFLLLPTHLVSSAHWWLQHTWMLSPPSGTCHGGYGAVIPSWNGEGGGGWFQGLLSSTPPSHPGTTSVSPSKPSKHEIWWTGQEDYGEHCNCVAPTLLVHNQYTIVCTLLPCQDAVVTTVGKSAWNPSLGFNVWTVHSLPGAWPNIHYLGLAQ